MIKDANNKKYHQYLNLQIFFLTNRISWIWKIESFSASSLQFVAKDQRQTEMALQADPVHAYDRG